MTTKADTLKVMRLQKHLTQADVAEKLKVSQSYYSSVERGAKPTEIAIAQEVVNKMRFRGSRTAGGEQKAGRQKG